jgi:hypothetical protein
MGIGLETLVSLLVFEVYLRLFEVGLPNPNVRPAIYLAVGPHAFTTVTIIKLSAAIPSNYFLLRFAHFRNTYPANNGGFHRDFLLGICVLGFHSGNCCLFGYGPKMNFRLARYAFVFPNCGFAIATICIGNALECPGIIWTATRIAVLLVTVWLGVKIFHARAAWNGSCLV